ncbi:MAG: DUF4191 domain-containing protein [Actinomycetaceae bacterium]|nr:DUF4191 domain-containing protein [Actinomycetaceae bacterium]
MSDNSTNTPAAPKKRRWYHNLADAYRVTKRSYPAVGWIILGSTLAAIALFILLGYLLNTHWIVTTLLCISLVLLVPMLILAALVKKAMYKQIDGTAGAVYAVISQIKRGWTVEEEPIAMNRERDMIWRLIGRPGVVLLVEGSKPRVAKLVEQEKAQVGRVVSNVPVHVIYVGHDKGQVPLAKVEKHLRKLPKTLRSNEVPLAANRLQTIANARRKNQMPQGIDPKRVKVSRRALRGR